jgi:tetratricopeptide (TPR) repeat protein
MQKRHIYLIAVGFFILVAGSIVVKYKSDEGMKAAVFYPLKDRKGMTAQSEEVRQVQKRFADLMKIIGTNPDDIKSRIALASLYIQEARITGDYMYYDAAAMKYVDEVLGKDSLHFEALTFKALLNLSQHHFAEGLELAEKAKQINPDNAFVYGILVDGHVELGNYTAAVEAADKMISIRPDIRSYSRVSYLREIHGDYPGAIEAMKLAVDAGPPGDEATEWARVQLGHLYETIGDLKNAEMQYEIALQRRPDYAYAIAGKGDIALSAKEYNKAIAYYLQADALVTDYSLKEELVEAYELSGKKNEGDSIMTSLITAMNEDAKKEKEDENAGHYADHELAHVYLKTGNYDKALEHAIAEYNRRPANIDVNETVAWVYYMKGDHKKALPYMETARKTNSKNPTLLCRAGLIYATTNDKKKAKVLLGELLASGSTIEESLKTEGANMLRTL